MSSSKIVWKLVISLAITVWAVLNLVPLKDTPFDTYVKNEAQGSGFSAVMAKAEQRVKSKESPSIFMALQTIGDTQKIDLSKYFPQVRLEKSLTNTTKRNKILLNELLRRSKGRLPLGLDLKGGVSFTLQMEQKPDANLTPYDRQQELNKAIDIIRNRVNAFGVAEPIIRPVGTNRIQVELAGLSTKDNPDVVNELKKPARLEFCLVNPSVTPDSNGNGEAPPGYQAMTLEQDRGNKSYTEHLYIKRIPEMTGDSIKKAYVGVGDYGSYRVEMQFTSAGAKRFADVTRRIAAMGQAGNPGRLAIVLDGKLCSAPTVKEEIDGGSAEISGSFTQREAETLANDLNNPLDQTLKVVEMSEVGPSLAQDSISSGVRASVIGAGLVAGFMLIYYMIGGIVAIITLLVNVVIVLGVLASIHATMTLPGIAGIVLTIGMAVDANILIFERIREELHAGKGLAAAVNGGFDKAFSTIVDANLTTLITALIMIWLGTGPVKGFGVTLAIGIFTTIFCALVVSRLVLDVLVGYGIVKKFPMLAILHNPSVDYMKYRKIAFIASWTLVVIGVIGTFVKRDSIYGIDFIGGEEITFAYQHHVDVAKIRQEAAQEKLGEVTPIYASGLGGGNKVLNVQAETGKADAVAKMILSKFPHAGFKYEGKTEIGPAIGKEIRFNAFLSLALSLVGILIYVAFRFEIGYAIGAVAATIHDILMTIGVFVLSQHQFNAPMVAAILLIAGYSINDTIVVFDRIREEMGQNPGMKLRQVINIAINRVLSRSLLTSFTTLLAAVSLLTFGSGAINDIAFTFVIGILTGTFSSIFIASPIFFWWHRGDRKHVEATHDIKPNYEWVASTKASK